MIKIADKQGFQNCLNSEKAVLFLNFKWSGYTKMVISFIYTWFEKSMILDPNEIDVFELYPEEELETVYMQWLKQYENSGNKIGLQQLRFHGYGDILWLRSGIVKGALSLYTELAFRKDKSMDTNDYSKLLLDQKTKEFLS